MITPQFDVRQDDAFVYVDIRAPYIKASHIQFEVSDNVFVFSLPPYYLRLRFPGNIKEDDFMTSNYDLGRALVQCRVSKSQKGEYFADLDMISKLLATKKQQEDTMKNKPIIQEINATGVPTSAQVAEPDFDWEIDQMTPPRLDSSRDEASTTKYGFNNQYSERVGLSMYTGNEINELAEPEEESAANKLRLMREATSEQFDRGHYAADLLDDEMIQDILKFKFPTSIELDADLKDRLVKLGIREFIIENSKSLYIGLIPLVFAWAYDFRINYGDNSVESSWTIGKLCPSLSYLFNEYTSVRDMVIDCTSRALTKPLYRHWELTQKAWCDTLQIFIQGKSQVLAVMAHLLAIFENDLHAVYRQIFIEDYSIWVQYTSDKVMQGLASELAKVLDNFNKQDLWLPIQELENEACTMEELSDSDDESDGDNEGDSNDEGNSDEIGE